MFFFMKKELLIWVGGWGGGRRGSSFVLICVWSLLSPDGLIACQGTQQKMSVESPLAKKVKQNTA